MHRSITLLFMLLTVVPAGAEAEDSKTHVVHIMSDYGNMRMYFSPKVIHIAAGDTVTWVNEKDEDHNIVSYPDGYPRSASALSSPYLKHKGETWSYTFTVSGTYEYHCIPHLPMGMHGSVIVDRTSGQHDFHEPTMAEMSAYTRKLREFFDEEEFKYKTRAERTK